VSGAQTLAAGPSSAAVQRFERDGFVKVGTVLDAELCSELRANFVQEARRRRARAESTLSADRFECVADDGTLALTVLLDHAGHRLEEAGALATLDRWATALLGVDATAHLSDEVFVKPAGRGGAVDWHQDWIVYPDRIPHFVTCWLALTDMTAVNGALEAGVGTHLLGPRAPIGVEDSAFAGLPLITTPRAVGHPTETLTLRAGEASFHHALTWHRSGPNRSDAPRVALAFRHRPARW
jgi:ectoine hydroxylase-related dioxygenase (phytanoyl-CoA dioxygenase family)